MDTIALSAYLKSATQVLHEEVEKKLNAGKIFSPHYTTEDYKELIRQHYIFFNLFEKLVFSSLSPEISDRIDVAGRTKLLYLEKDMTELGLETNEKTTSELSLTTEEAAGFLYVMEGSTLGGNVIKKQLATLPQFTKIPFHFFGCYGPSTGKQWTTFKEVLDSSFTNNQYDNVLAGAVKAYSLLGNNN
mgnify:CR=1 FL=1